MAFEEKWNSLKDNWFKFDTVLMLMVVFETWILTALVLLLLPDVSKGVGKLSIIRIVRLFRLTRAARMARLLRAVPEIMVIVKGLMVVSRTVSLIICVLCIF